MREASTGGIALGPLQAPPGTLWPIAPNLGLEPSPLAHHGGGLLLNPQAGKIWQHILCTYFSTVTVFLTSLNSQAGLDNRVVLSH